MTEARKYLIVLDAGDTVFFLERHGEHTECAENVTIFEDESEARLYIDKHGIDHIALMILLLLIGANLKNM